MQQSLPAFNTTKRKLVGYPIQKVTENTGIGIFHWYSRLDVSETLLPCKVKWNLLSDQIKCNLGSFLLILLHKYWPTNSIYFFWLFNIHVLKRRPLTENDDGSSPCVCSLLLISINLISLWIETDVSVNLCVSCNQWIQTLLQCQGWMSCCWDLCQLKGHGPSCAVSSEFHQASLKGSCYCLSPVSILKLLSKEASPVTNIKV